MSSRLRKARHLEIDRLEGEFASLCRQHKCKPFSDSAAKLKTARTALNLSLTAIAEKGLRWEGGRFYYQKDKLGPMLAHKLTPKIRPRSFPKIQLRNGTLTQNPQKIMEAFHDFYRTLYSRKGKDSPPGLTNSFLNSLKLPTIRDRHKDCLEAPISAEEISLVIKKLKNNSAPGPDGLSVPYYKHFAPLLSPYLARFFNHLRTGAQLDRALNSAFITVIPKPGKDSSCTANYRPISLINNDQKILTKIMADRLSNFIGLYIHKDQVGFMPG